MKQLAIPCMIAITLSGCGGGGGTASIPTPPITTPKPTPVNTSISDLRVSQSFVNDATKTDVSYNTESRTTISGRATALPVTVSYDAASNSYTIISGGFTDTFTPADKQANNVPGETHYMSRSGASSSYLTLVTTPYTGSNPNRYVAMGYAQRNTLLAERQDTGFTVFAYGLDTSAGGVPKTGAGTFATDVFGLSSIPGSEPEAFQGRGRFDVDFINGIFSTTTSVSRQGLISGSTSEGGGIDLIGGGRLTSANGTFSGDVVYSDGEHRIGGQLAGHFYGPNAEEIGASFSGSASDGSAFNGALTGQRDTTLATINVSFARLVTPELFYGDATTLTVRMHGYNDLPSVSDYPGFYAGAGSVVQFTDKTSGNVSFVPPSSFLAGGDYTVTSIVAGDANFTSYARTFADQSTRLELYKTGPDNRELALTYASFGRYSTTIDTNPLQSDIDRVFFVYGFNTPSGFLANRSGTASYSGVAYGTGANAAGAIYDVTGSSKMTVDFGDQSLSGSLSLAGRNGTSSIDYGAFGFAGKLSIYGSRGVADIKRDAGFAIGSMRVNFYGPSANEAAGIFRISIPDGVGANTLINGAMVAKTQ